MEALFRQVGIYSIFGFQRIGDLIWAAADMRTRGFLLGGTAGRTTLAGEGLQHQDGHSHVLALPVPNLVAYDPAFAFEIAIIIQDGIRRMYVDQESIFYYLTVGNEPLPMPAMPEGDGVRNSAAERYSGSAGGCVRLYEGASGIDFAVDAAASGFARHGRLRPQRRPRVIARLLRSGRQAHCSGHAARAGPRKTNRNRS